ncbi:CDP-diacylglycerol diphosphatase, partial [Xanthomonas sp. Kuri4-2]
MCRKAWAGIGRRGRGAYHGVPWWLSRSRCLKSKKWWGVAVALVLAACASVPPVRHVVDPGALWRIINNDCLREAGPPAADCAAVWRDPARQAVVLKDSHGDYQYLLLPIARIGGIESPALLAPGSPNYFAAAWQARGYVERAL